MSTDPPVCRTPKSSRPESGEEMLLSDSKSARIVLDRRVLTGDDVKLISVVHETKPKPSFRLRLMGYCSRRFSRHYCLQTSFDCLKCAFPFIDTLLHYRWRTDVLGDLSSGLTVGVMNVPQGMAYSLLAGLPPVYGLYASFIPPLLYAFLGRCPQLSLGTFAVISLLLSEPIRRLCDATIKSANSTSIVLVCHDPQLFELVGTYYQEDQNSTITVKDIRPIIAITLSCLIGIVQTMIGLLQIGNLACYLAPAMVDGFVTGASFHVFSSQISSLFGVKEAKKGDGTGSIFLVYVNLMKYITKTNMITLSISSVSILFLLVVKTVIDPACQRYGHCNFPLPTELLLVVMGTISSEFLYLNENHNVSVVGFIAKGMPTLTVPQWNIMSFMIADAVVIGFTSTFLTLSLVKLFAMKYHYDIRYNHEITSLGVITIGSSFLSSFAPSGSVSRSAVCEGAGAKTTLNGIASAVLIIFVLLFLGPYFSKTPTCVLSAIIVVALKQILKRVCGLRRMWKTYKRDFLLYFVTFSTTLVFNVTVGLVVGAICCLLALAEGQRTFRVTPLHNVPGTELFLPDTLGEVPSAKATWNGASTNHIPYEIIACQLVGSLNFASAEQLRARMKSFLEKNTHHANDSNSLENKPLTTSLDEKGEDNPLSKTNNTSNSKSDKACQSARKRYILLDVNGLSDVDPFGAQYLTDLHRELSGSGFAVVYVGEIHRHKCLDTSSWLRVPLISLSYPSLYDAYVACHNHLRLASTWMNSSEDLSKL